MSSNPFMKPLITGGLVIAGDKYFFNETDMTRSLYFGGATALGVYGAGMVANSLPNLGKVGFVDGKTLELRLAEIGLSAGLGYGLNRFVLKNDPRLSLMYNKIALIAGADFLAEYTTDYMENRPLSFFA